jgi:CheY-like chemotaxis protein
MLTKFGYMPKKDFLCAANGLEGVRAVERRVNWIREGRLDKDGNVFKPFDVVLMDLQMPYVVVVAPFGCSVTLNCARTQTSLYKIVFCNTALGGMTACTLINRHYWWRMMLFLFVFQARTHISRYMIV